jgi:uncharacterized membrane protein HdeD (DUF308 family)
VARASAADPRWGGSRVSARGEGRGRAAYRAGTQAMSLLMIVLGAVALVRTALAGAGASIALGYLMGAGFLVAGVLRLILVRRQRG